MTVEVKKHYVYISGSIKKVSDNINILPLCKTLSNKLLSNDFFLVSAAGSYIGNYIFGAVLKYLEENNYEQIRKRLIIDPIPNSLEKSEIEKHRIRLLSKYKSIIFISGGSGTREEYKLAKKLNLELIPIPYTGGEAKNIFDELKKNNLTDLTVLEKEVEINKIVDTVIHTLTGKRG